MIRAFAALALLLVLAGCDDADPAESPPSWTFPAPSATAARPTPVEGRAARRDVPDPCEHIPEFSCIQVEVTGSGAADIGWGVYVAGYEPGRHGIPPLGSVRKKLPFTDGGDDGYQRDPHTVLVQAHAARPGGVLTCRIWVDGRPAASRTGAGAVTCTAPA